MTLLQSIRLVVSYLALGLMEQVEGLTPPKTDSHHRHRRDSGNYNSVLWRWRARPLRQLFLFLLFLICLRRLGDYEHAIEWRGVC
jgi:hypothetical protein